MLAFILITDVILCTLLWLRALSIGVMEIDIISKVISLKMKTLIFAVICTSLHLDHHKGHAFRQMLYKSEGTTAVASLMKKILM